MAVTTLAAGQSIFPGTGRIQLIPVSSGGIGIQGAQLIPGIQGIQGIQGISGIQPISIGQPAGASYLISGAAQPNVQIIRQPQPQVQFISAPAPQPQSIRIISQAAPVPAPAPTTTRINIPAPAAAPVPAAAPAPRPAPAPAPAPIPSAAFASASRTAPQPSSSSWSTSYNEEEDYYIPGTPVAPYAFSFDETDEYGMNLKRQESSENGIVTGSYSFTTPEGYTRVVNYISDELGFRAQVQTNEPGTQTSNAANAEYYSTQSRR